MKDVKSVPDRNMRLCSKVHIKQTALYELLALSISNNILLKILPLECLQKDTWLILRKIGSDE